MIFRVVAVQHGLLMDQLRCWATLLLPGLLNTECNRMDSGLHSLAIIARFHELPVNAAQLQHLFEPVEGAQSVEDILRAAKFLGLKAGLVRAKGAELAQLPLPALAIGSDGEYFVLAAYADQDEEPRALVQRAGDKAPSYLTLPELSAVWRGELMLLTPRKSAANGSRQRFNLRWFIPALVKYRGLFSEVILASFLLQLFALVTPIFFQVVMDKVLVHRGFTTLNVLAMGYCIVVLFEALIGGLRNYLFSHTTNRVDVELGAGLFRHLVNLPMAYFEARQVGQTVARVRELETIRQFITGSALTLVIDLFFIVLFIAVMFYYSASLAWFVIGMLPFYVLLSLFVTPALRTRLDEKFNHGAVNQAFLTEAVSGIATLKVQALEPQMQRQWENQLAAYVQASFRATNLGNIAGQIAGLISKLMTLGIIWMGSHLVISGALTVGQLVAFNMIAARVTGPIQKLVQLWQDFQQAGISIRRLGDILNAPVESTANAVQTNNAAISGNLSFQRVRFRYRPDRPLVLDELSLDIRAGEMIGVVGPSGSGKSTLSKLIQRLYVPEAGRILIDGNDLTLLNVASLRRRIGVVQQESFLFSRSIRDNIAIANPAASDGDVIRCAQIAGAHDFILEMSHGYDALVEEQGVNLSGGQRQRIAIARALLSNPSILILDEATSALDYESENRFHANLQQIRKNRTLLIIAHRLGSIRHCDRILVIDKGRLLESGSHEQLLQQKGYYARLCGLQREPAHPANGREVSGRDSNARTFLPGAV